MKVYLKIFKQEKNNFIEKEKLISDSKTWTRSHGGNLNHKFSYSNLINTENIDKIKLKWKYESKKKTLNQYSKQPIF